MRISKQSAKAPTINASCVQHPMEMSAMAIFLPWKHAANAIQQKTKSVALIHSCLGIKSAAKSIQPIEKVAI